MVSYARGCANRPSGAYAAFRPLPISSKPLMKSDRGRPLQEDRTRRGKKHQFPLGLHHLSDLPFKTNVLPPEGRAFEVTNRMVFAIAVPMTLAFLTTPLLGLVDTAVVGRLGDAALLGGLAIAAILFDLVFTTFNFLRSATTGLVAQAMGRGDPVEEQAVFWRSLMISGRRRCAHHCSHAAASGRRPGFHGRPGRGGGGRLDLSGRSGLSRLPRRWPTTPSLAMCSAAAWAAPACCCNRSSTAPTSSCRSGSDLGSTTALKVLRWATVIAEITGCAMGFLVIRRRFDPRPQPVLEGDH
jgi:MATE family multidrug resistance protein